jgi:signal transduction histidine kinase
VSAADVGRALRDTAYRVSAERFDARDRVDRPASIQRGPSMVAGTDGRLWLMWAGGIGRIEPDNMPRNRVPPPVLVRALEAGGRQYAAASAIRLPKRTKALSIAYTASSLTVPERVRFRYRLLGLDPTWQDAGARREAFYTNLGPGQYRFEVLAANDDGVWSPEPAALDVVIPPAFVQTNAFLALCAAAAGGMAWWLVAWRQRRAAAALHARFKITLAERTRVARELHDTLLSGVAGIALRLDAVATRARSHAGVDVAALDELQAQARKTLVDARDAVVAMRNPGDAPPPLPAQLAEAACRVFAETDVDVRTGCTGTPCQCPPGVEEQVLRIATEALINARHHAHCGTVTVECEYAPGELCTWVRDDGRGFDPARSAAAGHFGLVGMHERAGAIGARLTVESAPGRGTAVRLVVPLAGPGRRGVPNGVPPLARLRRWLPA